jgi:peptide/nickel transport system substrate-binding protein
MVESEAGEPQYGGTLTTFFWQAGDGEPGSPDIADGLTNPVFWLAHILERPLIGDFEKYGPRGTNEYAFDLWSGLPSFVLTGCLLESWEIGDEKTVWHVRPGVMWHGHRPEVMKARELTAEDIAADIYRFLASPPGKGIAYLVGKAYATDKYTLVIETPLGYDSGLMYHLGYNSRSMIDPPEVYAAGCTWENVIGTGPFMHEEYVVGSHMTFIRNPDWWKTTIIDGKEYELPFIDKLVPVIIPDMTSQVAALRTGKIDFSHKVMVEYWNSLDKTNPELLSTKSPMGMGMALFFNTAKPPFDDVNLRRAISIGTDREAFTRSLGIEMLRPTWPLSSSIPSVYIPMEKLPEDIRILYDYNPTLARQMLDDLGIPEGFKMNITVASTHPGLDIASLFVNQMEKIGITAELDVKEFAILRGNNVAGAYPHATSDSAAWTLPVETLRSFTTPYIHNMSHYSNEAFDNAFAKLAAEKNLAERDRLSKEAGLMVMGDVPVILLNPTAVGIYWWPWIKNYYGERNANAQEYAVFLAHAWIDQELKKAMGYK